MCLVTTQASQQGERGEEVERGRKRGMVDVNKEKGWEKERKRQRQTETDKDRQRQTETETERQRLKERAPWGGVEKRGLG